MPELIRSVIKWRARFGRDPFTLLIVVLAGLGTAHILVRTATYGAAVDGDSVFFLSTAMNFLAGEGWLNARGTPLVWWPPLFPLLLVALGGVGIEPLEAGRLVNAAAFGLTILAAGLYLRSNLRSQWLTLGATVAILAALPLSHFASSILTEPLFVLLTLLALIRLAAFLQRGERTSLWWAAVFTALAALTRYPGVVLIGVGVLLLLLRRAPPLVARLKHAIVFGAVSSIPLAGVLARNWAVAGNLTGPSRTWVARQSLSDGLSQAVEVFGEWVVPPNAPDGAAYLLWLAVATVVLAGAAVSCHPNHRQAPEAAPPSLRVGPVLPFGVFAGGYLVFMIVVVPLTSGEPILSRFLLPVYVPLLLTAALLLDQFLSIAAAGWMGAVRYVIVSLVLLAALAHVGYSAHRNLTITAEARVAGFGMYNNDYCATSEILNYLRDTPIDGRMYSNNLNLAWFWDRTAPPGKHQRLPHELHSLTSTILRGSDGYPSYILWSRKEKQHAVYVFDDLDIRLLPGVEPVADLSDGAVFRVTTAEPFDAKRHRARKQRYVQQLIEQAGELVVHADSTWPIHTWGAERTDEQVERADEQMARAGWDVYRNGPKLTYRKKPCAPADVHTIFLLQVSPTHLSYLSADRRPSGFDLLDFNFRIHGGVRLDDQCVVTAQLPDYPIGRLYIGRWIDGNHRILWEMKAKPFAGERHRAQRQRYVEQLIAQADEQVARAGWNVYRTGRKLLYRKEPCAPADVQAKIVLHVIPTDPNVLSIARQQHGYDSLGFYFNQRGFRLDDQCIAIAHLPNYAISRIRVGQWIAKEDRTLWEAELPASR